LKSGLTGKWNEEARGHSLAGSDRHGNRSCGPSWLARSDWHKSLLR
jgi:hypothetical protein